LTPEHTPVFWVNWIIWII